MVLEYEAYKGMVSILYGNSLTVKQSKTLFLHCVILLSYHSAYLEQKWQELKNLN